MGANQRLETVFTTETVTYAAPTRYPRQAPSGGAHIGPARNATSESDSSKYSSNEDSASNYSTLSSRQSSTTTPADCTPNSSMDERSAGLGPRYAQPSNVLARPKDIKLGATLSGPKSSPDVFDQEMADEMVSVETMPAPLSSANHKTGLQSQNYQRSRAAGAKSGVAQPQAKPRLNFPASPDTSQPRRKSSAPAIPSPSALRSSPGGSSQQRRPSADSGARRSGVGDEFYSSSKYPSLQLAAAEKDPIMELGEDDPLGSGSKGGFSNGRFFGDVNPECRTRDVFFSYLK